MNGTTLVESLEARTLLAFTGLPQHIGDTAFDMGKRIVATSDGGYIEAGIFEGTVDFGTGSKHVKLKALGDTDIFLAKYNSASQLVWVKQLGGTAYEEEVEKQDTIDIAADPARAGGFFVNGVSADPLLAAELVTDLAVGQDGSIFLTANFVGPADVDPGPGRTIFNTFDDSYYDSFIVKLNSGGSLTWAKQIGDRFTNTINAMALDPSGNIYLTGLFSRTQSFVPNDASFTRTAEGRADAYVLKMNPSGKILWLNQFGSDATKKPERDSGNDIAVDSAGHVYVAGTFTGDATFGSTTKNSILLPGFKKSDAFVVQYDTSGALLKAVSFAGKGYDGITSLAVDSHNQVVIVGYYQGDEFDADPGSRTRLLAEPVDIDGDSTDLTDLFIEKLDSNLALTWIQALHGTGTEFADQIVTDASDNILIGGSFYGVARFGTRGQTVRSVTGVEDFDDANDNGRDDSYDAYILKLNSSGDTTWVKTIGAASDDYGAGVGVAADGSVLFTGRFRGTVDFDTTKSQRKLKGLGLADAFVMGFDANGHPLI